MSESAQSSPATGFARQLMVLLSGTALVQLLGLALSPLVARLYGPASFGSLAAAAAVSTLLATLAPLALESAIVLVDSDHEAVELTSLIICMSLVVGGMGGAFLFSAIWLGNGVFSTSLLQSNPIGWSLVVGVLSAATSATQALSSLATRSQQFGVLTKSRVAQSVATQSLTVSFGFIAPTAISLGSCLVVGQLVALALMAMRWHTISRGVSFSWPSWESAHGLIRRNRRYPLYTYPQAVLDSLRESSVVAALAAVAPGSLGQWSLVSRTIRGPLSILGSTVSQVFMPRVALAAKSGEPLAPMIRWVVLRLGLFGVASSVILSIAGPTMFTFVFGDAWWEAGHLAGLASPWIALTTLTIPFSYLAYVLKVNRLFLLLAGTYNVGVILICAMTGLFGSASALIAILSLAGSCAMGGILGWLLRRGSKHHLSHGGAQ